MEYKTTRIDLKLTKLYTDNLEKIAERYAMSLATLIKFVLYTHPETAISMSEYDEATDTEN